ncbi:hypothetical protein FIU84_10745 [Stutzerimonas frequens]|jgi:itaconate CoA-transferase|nr:hypothetical protein A3710_06460 [Stutzerimonas frequens]QFU12467.1 hypothetical protein FIU84_10745 [Stutzerimonas frequens]|tara:strand:+ start:15002 stop:15250 length:249 start_codon:yes stop_codon:yes gene_type:complete
MGEMSLPGVPPEKLIGQEFKLAGVEIDSPSGKLPALLPPGVNRAYEPRMDAIPAVGQHNESILVELGYSAEQIADLKGAGTL